MTFHINQVFEGEYPPEAALWCNTRGDCSIQQVDGGYQIIQNPEPDDSMVAEAIRDKRDNLIGETDYYLMPDYPSNPQNLEDSWIPKEYTAATVTGTGFTDGHGKITFIPVQVVADKAISIDAMASYEVTFSGSVGGFGQTDHVVSLNGLCGDDQYVFLKSVNVICGVDNEGNGVMACLVPDATGKIKSNALKFRTINMDESSATKTRTFKVYITVTAEISNTNFSLGQLFPITK